MTYLSWMLHISWRDDIFLNKPPLETHVDGCSIVMWLALFSENLLQWAGCMLKKHFTYNQPVKLQSAENYWDPKGCVRFYWLAKTCVSVFAFIASFCNYQPSLLWRDCTKDIKQTDLCCSFWMSLMQKEVKQYRESLLISLHLFFTSILISTVS